ncbi:MAG: ATP-binding protein [Xanthobacteraceae bacterium]
MHARIAAASKQRFGFNRYTFGFALRAAIIFTMSFAVPYGFLSGSRSEVAHYDPHLFALGTSALFAFACLGAALLFGRNHLLRWKIRGLNDRIEELEDRNWELRESEERARRFLEAQGDVIVRRDALGRITYANDAFCVLAGRNRDALLGTMYALDVSEQGEATLLPDGTRAHDQNIVTPTDARWIAWREVLVRTDRDHREIQSVGRDVTDRVEAERALAEARDAAQDASRAKSRFLAMVSHEIRTPLNGILGMADLLLDTTLTPEQTTYTKAVKTSGDTLLSLIEEILDFSKIEAGKLELEAQPFALQALIEEVVELLAPRAHAKGLEIGTYVDSRLPARAIGDTARLRQVLLNLIGNAVKFTERGGIAVEVEPGSAPQQMEILIRDTGIGIAPEEQARIFDEFEQGDADAARRHGGTGLGLAISKRIVERMGGRIGVQSVPGAGTTFRVTVPLVPSPQPAQPSLARTDLTGASLLLVSPGSVEAALVARRLRDWGAEIVVEKDEAAALARLPERQWHALMVDFALGAAAATALAAEASAIGRRIVLLTPADRHELPALRSASFTGYLIKPVRVASLAACMRSGNGFAQVEGSATSRSSAPAPTGNGLSVLIAEDNEINGLLARSLLTKLGHRPTLVESGTAAVAAWNTAYAAGTPYDLVLMDVNMPGIDGREATRRIRAMETERGETPTLVLALTANAFAEDREACLEAGMSGFLTKPLERDRLGDILTSLPALRRLAA